MVQATGSLAFASQALRTPQIFFTAVAEHLPQISVHEVASTFYQDCLNIQQGHYKLPWDMTTINHKQYNPFSIISL
jgi:hypothetical protein